MANPLFPTDTIKDIADSLGISTLSPDAAKQLAMDVEYRIQEVVQEGLKFMRHSKRTVLSPADISNALKALNIEVLHNLSLFVLTRTAAVWVQFVSSDKVQRSDYK